MIVPMNAAELEREALKLPVAERARLAETLLESSIPRPPCRRGLSQRTRSAPVTLPIIFHNLAEDELNEASAYYAKARPGLGDAFISEVQSAVDALTTSPLAGTEVENGVRWWLVRRFPYSVLYRGAR